MFKHDTKKVIPLETNMEVCSSSKKVVSNTVTNVGTSTRTPRIGKTFVTKMKSLEKKHDQILDSNSEANKDWINFIE